MNPTWDSDPSHSGHLGTVLPENPITFWEEIDLQHFNNSIPE